MCKIMIVYVPCIYCRERERYIYIYDSMTHPTRACGIGGIQNVCMYIYIYIYIYIYS